MRIISYMNPQLTPRFRQVIALAKQIAKRYGHVFITGEHVLLGFFELEKCSAMKVLKSLDINLESFRLLIIKHLKSINSVGIVDTNEINCSPKLQKTLINIKVRCENLSIDEITTSSLLLEISNDSTGMTANILSTFNINSSDIEKYFSDKSSLINTLHAKRSKPTKRHRYKEQAEETLLSQYSVDLTLQAATGQLDAIIGREKEIDRMIQILLRRSKNNPILIGEAGVGKTAIVEGLAQLIANGEVPDKLLTKSIYTLDLALLVAGTKYRGEFEERLKTIIEELANNKDSIIFIDEIHTITGTGNSEGALDASNILKPSLSRGELTCIGATTLDEYKEYIECDSALDRRFQHVIVDESTPKETEDILKGIKDKYELFHNIKYNAKVIKLIVQLADRYITDRTFPDKAIDIMDEVGAKARANLYKKCIFEQDIKDKLDDLQIKKESALDSEKYKQAIEYEQEEYELLEKYTTAFKEWDKLQRKAIRVTELDVTQHVSQITGIPVTNLELQESNRLRRLSYHLNTRIIGQSEAVTSIANTIKRSRAGLNDPNKPISSFLFLGPTGVGKTHSAKTLSEYLFDSPDNVIQINMSELMEQHSVSKLIGSPPGYVGYGEGGLLTEPVRRSPYMVILLDELEKAHPDVLQILLQLLEEGTLTDGSGNEINFRNTIIIMTSNIGAQIIDKNNTVGFIQDDNEAISQKIKKELKQYLRPEFINRIDEIIIFNRLIHEDLINITKLLLKKLNKRLRQKKLNVTFSDSVYEYIVNSIDNKKYGARPLRRSITKYIENKISDIIINNSDNNIKCIAVDVTNDDIKIRVEKHTQLTLA